MNLQNWLTLVGFSGVIAALLFRVGLAAGRHAENIARLGRIEEKVDRINGTVAAHDAILRLREGG